MSSNPYRLELLFSKYVAGACTQQELSELWSLMAELSDEERLSIGLKEAWNAHLAEATLTKDQWQEVYSKLQRKVRKEKNSSSLWIIRVKRYAVAAAILGIIFSGYIYYRTSFQNEDTGQSFIAQQQVAPVTTDTKVMTLPDGTEVTLRKNSTLYFDSSSFLKEKMRSVRLTGEAFFDVAHNADKPFIVHVGDYNIRVLGTAFNVNGTKEKFEVTVARGKVKVEEASGDKALGTLTKGNYLAIDNLQAKGTALITKNVDADSVSKWIRQDLAFNNINWKTAADMIAEKYGVAVELKNEDLNKCYFTGDFTDKSLDDCLDILCTLTNASWKKAGLNTISVSGPGCP